MSRLKFVVTAALSLTVAAPALSLAQDAAPATQPQETVPTTAAVVEVPIDQTSPRGALKVLTRVMDTGETAAAQKVLISDSEGETAWAAAMLQLSAASVSARKASLQVYGEEGAKAIIGDAEAAAAYALSAIDRSTEELQGDTATIRSSDGVESPIELRRINGEWRVPVKVFVGDAPAEKLTETAEKMTRQAAAIEAFCTEMTAGKYKSPEDAAQALQLAQVKAVFGDPPTDSSPDAPADAPATQPGPG